MKKICVIGIGYVGLPTAAMFASSGHTVVGYDINKKAVDALNRGQIIIEEPGLLELVKQSVMDKKLSATTTCPSDCNVYIIAVPTPINEDKTADMSYVESATIDISENLKKGDIVILESTSPPRTVEDLMLPILSRSGLIIGEDVLVAHSPERILPGKIIQELKENSRIVGGINEKSSIAVKEIYESFVEGEIFITTSTTAEMCKVMENTFRDVNIALANELAKMSEELGVNAWEVIRLSNHHPRVNLLSPGPGVGGHCIALDPWFLVEKSKSAKLINQARLINDSMPKYVISRIKEIIGGFNGQKIAIFGLTYKPNIDDIRESPVVHIWNYLKNENISVNICEPHVDTLENNMDIYSATEDCELILLAVNHDEFSNIDFNKLGSNMKKKVIFDTRNYWDEQEVKTAGFEYHLLGEK